MGGISSLFGGGKDTPTPDYTGAAQQTAAGNLQNLQYQTQANRPDMVTPWGTSTWSQGVGADGKPNNQWTNNVTLSGDQQQALDSQMTVQNNQSQLAQTLQGQVQNTMAGGFNAPQFGTYMNGVGGVQSDFQGFSPTGVNGVNQNSYDPSAYTGNYRGVSQNFYGGPNQQTQFNSGTQGLNQTFGSNAPGVNTNFSSSANGLNQNFSSGAQGVNTDPSQFTSSAGSTDLNAPQFNTNNSQAGATAAYNASTELLKDQWGQDTAAMDSKLRMQGLVPGSEAYDNAMQNLTRTQGQMQTQLANQAVVTGNNMANQNYASALAGYQNKNAAQSQAFGQGMDQFGAANSAIGQQYGQDMGTAQFNNTSSNQQFANDATRFGLNNQAQGQAFGQDATSFSLTNDARNSQYGNALAGYQAQNQAANTQFGNNLQSYQAQNDARTQGLQNSLAMYGAQLQGQNASNTAQQQAYNQALAGYGANSAAQQNSNAAQQQAYQQALQNYQTNYQSAYNNYMQPLNSMNAVMTGQQVQNPTFNGFSSAGYTPGADYSGATSALGQWNSAQNAQGNANQSQLLGIAGNLGSAYLMSSDARLKKNIFRVGNTEGGHAWYVWDWKDGSGKGRGVIAQEVAHIPGAVHVQPDGFLAVDYAAIH